MDTAEQVQKLEAAWSEAGNLDLRLAIEQASAKLQGEITEGFKLTTAAGRRLAEAEDPRSNLDNLHDSLQGFFESLISDHAKNEWGFHA